MYVPTVLENNMKYIYYRPEKHNENISVSLHLTDTAGQEEYENLRLSAYNGAHIIFHCFNINLPSTLNNIRNKWYQEVKDNTNEKAVHILLGLKGDLPHNVSDQEIDRLSRSLDYDHWTIISSMTDKSEKIDRLFEKALDLYFKKNNIKFKKNTEKRSYCCIC